MQDVKTKEVERSQGGQAGRLRAFCRGARGDPDFSGPYSLSLSRRIVTA
jgi:hypothetical protein